MVSLPTSPIAGITIPSTPAIQSALAYIQEQNLPSTVNHCIRGAIFAQIIASKHPALRSITNSESLILATLLHDLGWSTSTTCISPDKRFEVDGANAAHAHLTSSASATAPADLHDIWYAIALHTSPTISLHSPSPLVVATSFGIMADFLGPSTPGGFISEDEFREVLRAYPRVGFREDTKGILCGLCRDKPETTFDNFVGDMGRRFLGKEYEEAWEAKRFDKWLWPVLEANEVYES